MIPLMALALLAAPAVCLGQDPLHLLMEISSNHQVKKAASPLLHPNPVVVATALVVAVQTVEAAVAVNLYHQIR